MNPLVTSGLDAHRGATALSVNLNKVALLRNTRALGIPSVTRAATIAIEAGAQGITVHPRPDERHIRVHDVHELAELLKRWPQIELNTESYARAHGTAQQMSVLAGFTATAQAALREGLGINAGHDLNRDNLTDFLAAVPGVQEVSIGHALIADALELGLAETVRDY